MGRASADETSLGVSQTGYHTIGPIHPLKMSFAKYFDHAMPYPEPSGPVGEN